MLIRFGHSRVYGAIRSCMTMHATAVLAIAATSARCIGERTLMIGVNVVQRMATAAAIAGRATFPMRSYRETITGNHNTAANTDVMITLASAGIRSVQIANAMAGISARYTPPGRTSASAMLIAVQQSAWPMKSPSYPARGRSQVAQTIAIAHPINHIAVIIGAGCATHCAFVDRSDANDVRTPPTPGAPMMIRRIEKTPRVMPRA